ncbi:PepSY-like domain-containing protein [Ohtaekwangia koreensis]|uniref:Putative beta-lactamase-inhibitor-like, PepSY-like n=1 Tax=Ohtaekwangia koreensis TaxID=688867 RepID=A0A1T5M6X0_9BACT|nr:PepSY-like domain-containing protein [Ohtaekwangia koreensis]SKC83992.1 Putative beta-lactamase-inhibitor-like, PepSY-like [Ohtaekwangia koreensis]
MKKATLITAMLLWAVTSFAQDIPEAQVPPAIVSSFKKEFANATDVKWEKKQDAYTVKFDIGAVDHKAWLDNAGKIVKHKTDIKESELPAAVTATLKKEYSNYKVSGVNKVQEGNTITYEMDLKNDTEKWETVFGGDGKVVKKKKSDKPAKAAKKKASS